MFYNYEYVVKQNLYIVCLTISNYTNIMSCFMIISYCQTKPLYSMFDY